MKDDRTISSVPATSSPGNPGPNGLPAHPGPHGAAGAGGTEREIAPEKVLPSAFVWSLDRSSDVGRAMLAATGRLSEAECESAQLDSAVVMAHVLGVSKSWLYAHPSRTLAEGEIVQFEALIRRRMSREPVAYLVGSKSFYGLDVSVDPRVLIPRPETELLVERVLAYLKGLIAEGWAPRVADVGTGSGAIAVALAVNAPEITVYATDLSEDALVVAARNVWRYGVGDQVQLLPGHLLDAVPEPVDVIVANLPYVATPILALLPPEVRDYEPILALDGGPDGLAVISAFLEDVGRQANDHGRDMPDGAGRRARHGGQPARVLRSSPLGGGRIYLEIGSDQGPAVHAMAEAAFADMRVDVLADYAGLDRLVVVWSPVPAAGGPS